MLSEDSLSPNISRKHRGFEIESFGNHECCAPAELIANISIVVGAILFIIGLMFLASYLAPNALPTMTKALTSTASWFGSDLLSLSLFSIISSFALSFIGSSLKACAGSLQRNRHKHYF